MASKRNQRRKACERKIRYTTLDEANHANSGLGSRHMDQYPRTYHCTNCGGYHIGHRQTAKVDRRDTRTGITFGHLKG